MGIGMLFWVLFIVALVVHIWAVWPIGRTSAGLIVWILLFLLGWRVFGFPIQDDGPRPVERPVIYTR